MDHASSVNASQILLTALSNTKILKIHIYADNQTAQNDLSQGTVQAVMVIPTDFSQSLASYQAAPDDPSQWTNTTVSLYLRQRLFSRYPSHTAHHPASLSIHGGSKSAGTPKPVPNANSIAGRQ